MTVKVPIYKNSFFLLSLVFALMLVFPVSAVTYPLYYPDVAHRAYPWTLHWNQADLDAMCSSHGAYVGWPDVHISASNIHNGSGYYLRVLCNAGVGGCNAYVHDIDSNNMSAPAQDINVEGYCAGGSRYDFMRFPIDDASPLPPTADFIGYPRSGFAPLTVNFTDNSTGGPTSRNWNFGDGTTSSETNPQHSYMNIGYYTVNYTVTGTTGSNTTTKTDYITVFPPGNITPPGGEYHIDVDVKDTYGGYVENSNVGIWDNSAWYNASCPSGSCGFVHHGVGGMLPVELKHQYTVKAWKDDYSSAAQTFILNYDHYPVALTLTPDYSNGTLISRINVDIKDKAQNKYIENAYVSLYRYSNSTWSNYTCPSGACGFKGETIGGKYDIWASGDGYQPNFTTIIHNNNWEIYTLSLDPLNPFDKNLTLHMDIDVRNFTDYYPIPYAEIGLYDIENDEWQNSTCVSGACGYTTSGASHQYPLKLYNSYGISVRKTGYIPKYDTVVLSYDHQLFTELLSDTVNYTGIQNITVVQGTGTWLNLTNASILPTPFQTPSLNVTWNFSIPMVTIPTIAPTWSTPAPVSLAHVRAGINPMLFGFLDAVDRLFYGFFVSFFYAQSIILSPLTMVASYGLWASNMATGFIAAFADIILFFSAVIQQLVATFPAKFRNTITFCLLLDIVYQVAHIKPGRFK